MTYIWDRWPEYFVGRLRVEYECTGTVRYRPRGRLRWSEAARRASLPWLECPEFPVVVHCYRAAGATIRIVTARNATRAERAQYIARWEP